MSKPNQRWRKSMMLHLITHVFVSVSLFPVCLVTCFLSDNHGHRHGHKRKKQGEKRATEPVRVERVQSEVYLQRNRERGRKVDKGRR